MTQYNTTFCFGKTKSETNKIICICDTIERMLLKWQEDFSKEPFVVSVIIGIKIFEYIKLSWAFDYSSNTINVLGIKIPCKPDWSVDPYYFEINLK